MQTPFDFITVGIFAGLIVLFLHRSLGAKPPPDSLVHYAIAAAGCAATNILGNHGYDIAAVLVFAATLWFIFKYMRPFWKQ